MTGLEELRELVRIANQAKSLGGHLPTFRGEPLDTWLTRAVAKLERETLPRPLFEDGEPVDIGSCIGEVNGTDYGLTGEPVKRFEISAVHDSPGGEWAIRLKPGQVVKRPEPPDTWERIEADANTDTCDYNGDECQATMCSDCQLKHRLEIVRRCKALAGVE